MTTVESRAVEDWLLDRSLSPDSEDAVLAPLYRAAAGNELVLPFCAACVSPLELDQKVCDRCGRNEADWRTVEPTGVVHAATLMHRREPGLVQASHPYPIVDVELTSGHRLIMTTMYPAAAAPAIGLGVRIGFRRLGDVSIPAIDTLEDQ